LAMGKAKVREKVWGMVWAKGTEKVWVRVK
jgi:hypothetical protein